MSVFIAWEDLWDCPRQRPFWCSHPHCLWCNWDSEDADEWTLAASLGPTLPFECYYHPSYPNGHYIQDRRYVAWLCEECAALSVLVRWFTLQVRGHYRAATIFRSPGSSEESVFTRLPIGRAEQDLPIPQAWAQVPIPGTDSPIRKD